MDKEAILVDRERTINDMVSKHLEYIDNGREGYVIYKDGDIELKFMYELAGGRHVALIYIPTNESWYNKTGTPTNNRHQIIEFLARQVIKDRAPNAIYELHDDCICLLQETNQ